MGNLCSNKDKKQLEIESEPIMRERSALKYDLRTSDDRIKEIALNGHGTHLRNHGHLQVLFKVNGKIKVLTGTASLYYKLRPGVFVMLTCAHNFFMSDLSHDGEF